MSTTPLSLTERQRRVRAAEARLEAAGARYLEARARGQMTDEVAAEIRSADLACLRAQRALDRTMHRLSRSPMQQHA